MDRRILQLLTRSALWAIQPEAWVTVLQMAASPSNWSGESWEAAKPYQMGKGSAKMSVIPIQGVLGPDVPSWWGTSYGTITDAIETAVEDKDVKRIVLSVDSPGGEVTGLPETAQTIAEAAKVKPVSAVVEGVSASAAYWLTSQAGDITLAPSGEVGSVGVRMMHMDVSKMLEDMGVKVTELYAGAFKTEWSPYAPLTDAAKADMQPRLDAVHSDFINSVAAGRGVRVSKDIQDARFGEGRMFSARDAMTHGLVDSVQAPRLAYRAMMPPAEENLVPTFPVRNVRAALNILKAKS